MKITNKYGPNTTILLPGSCSARCDFCFWNRDEAKIKPPSDYIDRVDALLLALPEEFRVLSISGGEPTESKFFVKFLARLAKTRRNRHFDRVVLTTNGSMLHDRIGHLSGVVDHINISRHGIGTASNREAFGGGNIPTDTDLKKTIAVIHDETDCDVTFNCVVAPEVTTKFCFDFIGYAKELGADAISFRKAASDVTPTAAEKFFTTLYGVEGQTNCPVCRGMEQDVEGFRVRWKGSVMEPSIETNGIYELVIHPDGNLYADWGMSVPVDIVPHKVPPQRVRERMYASCGSSGCGSRGC